MVAGNERDSGEDVATPLCGLVLHPDGLPVPPEETSRLLKRRATQCPRHFSSLTPPPCI